MESRRMVRFDEEGKLAETLEKLCATPPVTVTGTLRRWVFSNVRVKLAAIGVAAAIWSTSFLSSGTTVRTVSVPVQFVGVPAGLDVAAAVDRLEVEVRGSAWLMDSVSLTRLFASFNLRGARPGTLNLPVDSGNLNLPPGIEMENVAPKKIAIRLTQHGT
jgi:hypothetical protein